MVLFVLTLASCKDSNQVEGDASGFFPVLSYLKSQARHVDTSVYNIVKITKTQGRHDTAFMRREDFKTAAQDFLSLPDVASDKLKKKYTETKLYDEDLKKVVLSYLPKETGEEVVRQDVIIEPDAGAGDQVQTIYTETVLNHGDSTVQKRMTWNVNKSFQVIRIVSNKNNTETVQTTDVTWTQ